MSANDPTDLRAQEAATEQQALRARIANETEDADWKWLMGSKRGRRIVWRLLEQAGVFRLSFDLNNAKSAFNEGNRNYGLRTLAKILSLCPELFPAMLKESKDV